MERPRLPFLLNRTKPANHEKDVISLIRQIEIPFMSALSDEFGTERGWRICGPASVALSRIISSRLGIPIGRGLEAGHLEVSMGIFDPQDDSDRLDRIEEQTYIRYCPGNRYVYYIDPIYGLLMENRQLSRGAIQVEKYPVGEVDRALIMNHNLYLFDPNHVDITERGFFKNFPNSSERQTRFDDFVTAMNDHRATMERFLGNSGLPYRSACNRVKDIINHFAPEWQQDAEVVAKEEAEYIHYLDSLVSRLTASASAHIDRVLEDKLSRGFNLKLISKQKAGYLLEKKLKS